METEKRICIFEWDPMKHRTVSDNCIMEEGYMLKWRESEKDFMVVMIWKYVFYEKTWSKSWLMLYDWRTRSGNSLISASFTCYQFSFVSGGNCKRIRMIIGLASLIFQISSIYWIDTCKSDRGLTRLFWSDNSKM